MARVPSRPEALTRGRQPFRGSSAVAAGLVSWAQLRRSAWRRLFRDVYVDTRADVDHRLLIAGAVLLIPDLAVIAGRSAAQVWGAETIGKFDRVEIDTPVKFGPIEGLAIRVGVVDPGEVTVFRGVRVTSGIHTAWDLARRLPLIEAVQWVDSLARARRLSRTDLIAHGDAHPGLPGLRRAADAMKFCDPRAESPPESVLRVHLHQAGIMVVAQFWVIVGDELIARVDLALPEIQLAIEYDGQWHGDPDQLGRDRARVRLLKRAGWEVFQVTKEDLRNVGNLIQSIREVIERLKRSRG